MIEVQLADQRQESFAVYIASGKSKRASAILCGYTKTSAPNMGVRLSRLPAVIQRVAELRSTTQQNTGDMVAGTKPWVRTKYIEIVQIAMTEATRDLNAARLALDSIARLDSMVISESRQIKETHAFDHTSKDSHIAEMLKDKYGALTHEEQQQLRLVDPSIIDVTPDPDGL